MLAKEAVDKLFAFASENNELLDRASGPTNFIGVLATDSVRYALQRMLVSAGTRQASISVFFGPGGDGPSRP